MSPARDALLCRVGQGATATRTHHSRKNTKIESRNPKQYQNPKKKNPNDSVSRIGFGFRVLNLLRISSFDFRIFRRIGGSATLSLLDPPYNKRHFPYPRRTQKLRSNSSDQDKVNVNNSPSALPNLSAAKRVFLERR